MVAAPGGFYPITGVTPKQVSGNESLNMQEWDNHEFRTFMKWFIEVNHPEAIEQYQAVRAIERKIEQEESNRRYREMLEAEIQLRQQAQAQRAQNAYPYSQSPYATTQIPEPKSIWERAKELAGIRKIEHGDYY